MPQVVGAALGSLALGATAGAGLAASAAAFAAATAIGSALGSVALIVGPSLLIKALTPSAGSGPINTPEARGSVRQATPTQRVIYGYARVGGAAFFIDDSKPPYLYVGLLISARAITEYSATYIGTKRVQFQNNGLVNTGDFISSGVPRLVASFRLGSSTQAIDPLLATGFPNLDAEFRQRGIATIVARYDFGLDAEDHQALWGNVQIPNLLADVKGAPIYDPRDPTQAVDDPATWKFSNNASLVIADYLRASYGGRIASSRMRWDEIATAANYDDEPVGLKDGSLQPRHTIDGVVTMNQPPVDVLQSMLAANRGFVVQSNGFVSLSSSKPRTPQITINDKLIAGGFEYRAARPRKELINKVRVRFVAEDRDYQVVDGPILVDAGLETEDDETLEGTFQFPFTRGHPRAQRLGFAAREESRLGRALTVPVSLDILAQGNIPKAGSIIVIDSRLFPAINGIYSLEEIGWAGDFSKLQFSLAEYDGSIDGRWLPDTMEQDFVLADLDVS